MAFKIVENGFFEDLCSVGFECEVLASRLGDSSWFLTSARICPDSLYDKILRANKGVACPYLGVSSISPEKAHEILNGAEIPVSE